MRIHLKITVSMACIAGAFSPAGAAEDKIDFFKRFLDESPRVFVHDRIVKPGPRLAEGCRGLGEFKTVDAGCRTSALTAGRKT